MGTSKRQSSRVMRRYARRRLRRRALRRNILAVQSWFGRLIQRLVPQREARPAEADVADFFNYDIDHRSDSRRVALLAPARTASASRTSRR